MKTKTAVLISLFLTIILFFNMGWNSTSAYSINSQIQSRIWYVKPGAEGTTCTSWDDPCELNPALHWAVPSDQIWVAAGTYKPDPTGVNDRNVSFQLKSGVAVYGGFAGTETSIAERDWITNETILSGDIGAEGDNSDNSYHVVTGRIVDATAILDGFTITAGNADGSQPADRGAGMYNYQSSPTLTNLVFTTNTANFGGAMYNHSDSSPSLTAVTFLNNTAWITGGGMLNEENSSPTLSDASFDGNLADLYGGGGMANYSGSNPILTNVIFSNNIADGDDSYGGGMLNSYSSPILTNVSFESNSAGWIGGGIYNQTYSDPVLTDVSLSNNSAVAAAGGIYNGFYSNTTLINVVVSGNTVDGAFGFGGGIYNVLSDIDMDNVTFSNNTAPDKGGGIYNDQGSATFENVTFNGNSVISSDGEGGGIYNHKSSTTLTNVTFSGNSSLGWGGGIHNYWSNITLTNATFTDNSASFGGGIFNNGRVGEPAHLTITNSILWGNTPDQIYNFGAENIVTITYSLLDYPSYSDPTNITGDPLLGPLADNGGFTLTHALGPGSPAIDAGDPSNCPSTDQRGFPRPVDGDGVDGPRCDMGAYEFEVMETDFPVYLPMIVR